MNILNFEKLKEHKKHGESMLPIALYRVKHNSQGNILPYHWHNEFEFIYVSEGHAVFTINDEEIPVQAGECIFVNSGQIHSGFSQIGNSAYISVVFSSELLSNSFSACKEFFDDIMTNRIKLTTHFTPVNSAHRIVISELKAVIDELTEKNEAYEFALKSMMFSMFCTIIRKKLYITLPMSRENFFCSKRYTMLKNILGYISDNYNKEIRLIDISKTIHLTPQYLCRFFKEMTGCSVIDYVNRYRIETAGTLLKASSLSITDIALECGFDNMSYFNRVFKSQTGRTPTEFRSKDGTVWVWGDNSF